MKKNSSVISLSFLVLFLLVVSLPSICFSEEWVLYGEISVGTFSYDKDSITNNKDNTISVRIKHNMSSDVYKLEEFDPSTKGSRTTISSDSINCKSNKYKLDYIIYYDGSGKVIFDSRKTQKQYKQMDYKSIPDDTIIQNLRDKVCPKSDWVKYSMTEDGNVFLYDKTNITKSGGKNIVQVWTKWIYSNKEREKELKVRRKSGFSTEEWDKLSYSIFLNEIECKNKKLQVLSVTIYDTDGNVLNKWDNDKPKWTNIVPGSDGDVLRKKVCK